MSTNKAIKTILILLFLIFPLTVYAWTSIGDENHRRITNDAINDLGIYDYPDLDMYRGMYGGNGVVEGSATEGSHTDPETGIEYWEGPYEYWKSQATNNYKASNFRNAYDYFGYYLHLRQDIFVPAHIKKCAHWVRHHWTDRLESFADSNHVYSPGTISSWGGYDKKGHYWEYWLDDNEDDDDGDETTADVNDSSQRDGPNSYNLLSTWGTYGKGKWPNDLIPGNDKGKDWYTGDGNSAFIAYEQLYKAYSDTKAKLKEFSESLPPLLKDLDITSSLNCNTQSDFQISFKILENRKKTVKIFMTVDGEAIISPEYGTGKSFDLFSGTDLPWEGAYSVTWDRKLANGEYPSDGEHTLYVSVEDEDGNVSEVAQHQFRIDTGPLTIAGAETITRNSSAQYTATGCPSSINWSVSGTGATISSTGLLTAGATSCGSLTVTATCSACETSAEQYVRVTDAGQWIIVSNTYGTICSPTCGSFEQWAPQRVEGKSITQNAYYHNFAWSSCVAGYCGNCSPVVASCPPGGGYIIYDGIYVGEYNCLWYAETVISEWQCP